jgi:hypothetical protein
MARKTATFSRPADNTAYQSGDAIANSTSAAAVVPMTFTLDNPTGKIVGCSAVVTPASGSLVITALDFDLLIFRPVTDIPFAAGSYIADNAQMSIAAAAMRELIGVFTFAAGAWRNPLGALTAGASGHQAVAPSGRTGYQFDTLGSNTLIAVVQAKGAWTPTGVINRFDFALDLAFE